MEHMNSIYYTFSTIAQVIAGFIALSGVFVLFKLQELKKLQLVLVQYFLMILSNNRSQNTFYGCPQIAIKLKTLLDSESTSGIMDEVTKILLDEEISKSPVLKHLTYYKNILNEIEKYRNKIKLFTNCALLGGIVTITFSLIILGNTHYIPSAFSPFIIWCGIVLTTITILSMAIAIYFSLKDYNPISKPL